MARRSWGVPTRRRIDPEKRAPKPENEHLVRLARQGCAEGNWISPPLVQREPHPMRWAVLIAGSAVLAIAGGVWIGW